MARQRSIRLGTKQYYFPRADALRPSELFEHLEALKKSLNHNEKETSQEEPDTIEAISALRVV